MSEKVNGGTAMSHPPMTPAEAIEQLTYARKSAERVLEPRLVRALDLALAALQPLPVTTETTRMGISGNIVVLSKDAKAELLKANATGVETTLRGQPLPVAPERTTEDGGTSLTEGDAVSVSVPTPELPHDAEKSAFLNGWWAGHYTNDGSATEEQVWAEADYEKFKAENNHVGESAQVVLGTARVAAVALIDNYEMALVEGMPTAIEHYAQKAMRPVMKKARHFALVGSVSESTAEHVAASGRSASAKKVPAEFEFNLPSVTAETP